MLLALAAVFSNAGFFLGLPGSGIPWLILALAIAALVCAAVGIMRAFRQPQVYGGKVSSSILGVVSLLICGFAALISVHSRDLPVATGAPQVGQKVPEFTLADTNGNKVSLGQLLKIEGRDAVLRAGGVTSANYNPAPKAVLLVFYRGYW